MTRLRLLQRAFVWLAVAFVLLTLLASGGCGVLPPSEARWTLLLHPVLLLAGAGCGLLTRWRAREIDANRWRVLSDPLLTRGEKEWAHHDAEAERRRAAVVFLLCPLVLGMWLAYDLGEEGPLGFLPVTGLVGFGIGLLAGTLLDRTERRGA